MQGRWRWRHDGHRPVCEKSLNRWQLIRHKLNLSQSAFAGLLGVSISTLQDWEQGRREPQGPAVALLRIAEQHPEVFEQLH
ncbi:helix-turn-helix domain-containing protein [Vreelandella zhaodongensis]|uniref:helix-turn-helix domain-containing protein n=1 Tax=Vreelandella zhaodongensis TaxID=1176240 RepID=UPI003EB96B34